MANNIRLDIAYDGTDYQGWQVQAKGGRTVQGELEKALEKIHKHPIKLIGSGRTDSGVHASHQVANFQTDLVNMEPSRFMLALNSLLPRDIRIKSSSLTHPDFHSRYDAVKRIYYYYIKSSWSSSPFDDRYCYTVRDELDIHLLNKMCRHLVGFHDYTTFTNPKDMSKTRTRHIYSAVFFPEGSYTVFKIAGNAFLWRMVRSIVGTLLECYRQGGEQSFVDRFHAKDRSATGVTAPARGLFLHKVYYKEDEYFPL
ncbi:tRNA pseudouridine(38-40) synthase TruA [Spirochaeta cellobiosiphila]|uniref:tRNA pseudouridine(38-40) synthase TruA n=1 Tax=Spirochaeta cellobiosiphila TaxID=504483 RepID=UPI0004209436|nr:tRNA pseudouridine(38-40) synthase TruA [Spirochaeta cellobiosiphila]